MTKKQEKKENDSERPLNIDSVVSDLDLENIKKKHIEKYHKGLSISDELLIEAFYEFKGIKTVIAKNCGINRATLASRINKSPKLTEAFQDARKGACDYVFSKLMQRIEGYNVIEEKLFCSHGKVIRAQTVRHYPPDVRAMEIYFDRFGIKSQEKTNFESKIKELGDAAERIMKAQKNKQYEDEL